MLRGWRWHRPNHWAMDITYIPMARGFVYLAVVLIGSAVACCRRTYRSRSRRRSASRPLRRSCTSRQTDIFNPTRQPVHRRDLHDTADRERHRRRHERQGRAWRDNVFVERLWRGVMLAADADLGRRRLRPCEALLARRALRIVPPRSPSSQLDAAGADRGRTGALAVAGRRTRARSSRTATCGRSCWRANGDCMPRRAIDSRDDPDAGPRRAPDVLHVWVRPQGGASLVASTPELLVRRRGREVTASALAGTAPRPPTRGGRSASRRGCWRARRTAASTPSSSTPCGRARVARRRRRRLPDRPELLRLPEAQHLATWRHRSIAGPLRPCSRSAACCTRRRPSAATPACGATRSSRRGARARMVHRRGRVDGRRRRRRAGRRAPERARRGAAP